MFMTVQIGVGGWGGGYVYLFLMQDYGLKHGVVPFTLAELAPWRCEK